MSSRLFEGVCILFLTQKQFSNFFSFFSFFFPSFSSGHHCRVCGTPSPPFCYFFIILFTYLTGHLFCGECIVKLTLPATLGFNSSQKSCVKCAYKAIRMRGNFVSTIKDNDGLSISQKLSGRMQNFFYRMAGMYEGMRGVCGRVLFSHANILARGQV